MSTHLPGFQSFSAFSQYFVLIKLATSSIRVKILSSESILLLTVTRGYKEGFYKTFEGKLLAML